MHTYACVCLFVCSHMWMWAQQRIRISNMFQWFWLCVTLNYNRYNKCLNVAKWRENEKLIGEICVSLLYISCMNVDIHPVATDYINWNRARLKWFSGRNAQFYHHDSQKRKNMERGKKDEGRRSSSSSTRTHTIIIKLNIWFPLNAKRNYCSTNA